LTIPSFLLKGLHGLQEQALGHAVTAAARLGTGLAFGEKPKDILKSTAVNYVADVASGSVANKLGEGRLEGLDPTIHKLGLPMKLQP